MNSQTYKALSIFPLVLGMLPGCTGSKSDNTILRIHLPSVKLKIDPQKMEDLYSMAIVSQLYRGLLRYNTSGDVISDIAESWTESADHKSYEFKLKPFKFSNGSPITPQNVQATFARLFYVGAAMGADIDYIAGVSKFKISKNINDLGIKITGPNTVEFQLEKPSSLFLKQLAVADCSILPIANFIDNLDSSAVGAFSGPYQVTRIQEKELVIQKWRDDKLDSPNPPKQVLYVLTDDDPTNLALENRTDSLDHYRISDEDQKQLESLGWAATPTELTGEVFVILNPDKIPLPVRKYLYSKIDPKELHGALKRSKFTPAFGVIPNALPGEVEEKKIATLKNSNYQGPKAIIELEYGDYSELDRTVATFLKKKWETPLIQISLKPFGKSEKLQRMFGKKAQAIIGRKSLDYPDGFSVLTYFKGSYESNYFFVNDPAIDRAILSAVQIFDERKRADAYKEIQISILKHYTIIPLLFGSEASGLWSKNVRSVPSHSLGYHTLPIESVEMR